MNTNKKFNTFEKETEREERKYKILRRRKRGVKKINTEEMRNRDMYLLIHLHLLIQI